MKGALLALLLAGPALAQEGAAPLDLRVPRERLSTQDDAPFLFAGEVMNERQTRWDEYAEARADYPDMLSCLNPEARDDPVPDLAQAFDWMGIEGRAAMEVCLFRLGASLGTPERVGAWMAAQGMWMSPDWAPTWRSSRTPNVSGSWRLAEVCERSRILGSFRCFVLRPVDPFFVFVIGFDEEGDVVGASVNGNAW